ncbi:MAG TPA: UbiD family decarboxylase [Anaerolineae bacterium]|nr:UbiD family decarboxylase [Anaerolineae bacterium]
MNRRPEYQDLRKFLKVLEDRSLLQWVDQEVDKEWEITAVTRTLFRKHPPENRPALGFRRVKGYDIPVVVGTVASSRAVYALALGIEASVQPSHARHEVEQIIEKWGQAQEQPIPTELVSEAPCQEIVLEGDDVDLTSFPIPTWTPEKDPGPYVTAPCVISKDRKTGIQNVGIYRMQVKSPKHTGMLWDLPSQHGALNYDTWESVNEPMPVAVAVGVHPTVLMTAATKVPYGVDELTVSGALNGAPVPVVKCKTADLEVPAMAEMIIEGEIAPHEREIEGPFGEYTGYMGGPYELPIFRVKCITHRRAPIYQALFSQMPPSESSLLRQIGEEARIWKHLVHALKLPGVIDVHLPEAGGSYAILWVRLEKRFAGHAQQVMSAAWSHHPSLAKWVIITDEDIDIRDPFQREWVLSWRVEPQKDIFIMPNTASILLDPSPAPPDVPLWGRQSSKVFVDATKKWEYPEIALPPQKYLDEAEKRWNSYGLEGC